MSAAAPAGTEADLGGEWVDVGGVDDVPELEGRSVQVADRRIAVFRLPDGWAASDAACPHRGGPLADGIVADCSVTCPLHNRRFDLSSGERIGEDGPGVTLHAIREDGGRLLVRVSETT